MTDAYSTDICTRCAAQGPTCCRLTPGTEEHAFPLSELERQRIQEHVGNQGFFVREHNSAGFVSSMKRLFPGEQKLVEEMFHKDNMHLRLATTPEGACTLLSNEGCVLPPQVRPYYCRLYPFWVFGERITMFTPDFCLAVREARAVRKLFGVMHAAEADVRRLHGRLRLAWGLPPRDGAEAPNASEQPTSARAEKKEP